MHNTITAMFFLGIDAGGTKTHALVASDDFSQKTEYITGAGNYKSIGLEQATQNIKDAAKNAIDAMQKEQNAPIEIAAAVIGIASLDTPHDREVLTEAIQKAFRTLPIQKCKLVNDTKIALRAGSTEANALVLITGTGSHCFGLNHAGKEVHVGGLDFVLSDEGSGYMIGAKALRAAVQSMDGRIPKSELEQLVTTHLKVASMREAKDITTAIDFNKTKIGALAHLVFSAAQNNDRAALQILDQTVEEARQMVNAAVTQLHYSEQFDIVLSGGLFEEELFKKPLVEKLASDYPQATLIFPQHPPVYGALQLAIKSIE